MQRCIFIPTNMITIFIILRFLFYEGGKTPNWKAQRSQNLLKLNRLSGIDQYLQAVDVLIPTHFRKK